MVAFDADDTLWLNEPLFRQAERQVADALSEFGSFDYISDELYKIELKNMPDYGFGAKAYVLSMIENALNLSGGNLSGEQVRTILESGRSILRNPARPLPGVVDTLEKLSASGRYRLVMLTKGELLDQEHKIERSGLGKYFSHIEIVSNKSQRLRSWSSAAGVPIFLPKPYGSWSTPKNTTITASSASKPSPTSFRYYFDSGLDDE